MATAYCFDERFLKHTYQGHPENAGRLLAVMKRLQENGLLDRLDSIPAFLAGEDEIARVHTRSYIDQVKRLSEHGGGHLDSDTYVTAGTYEAALSAAGGLIAITRAVLDGKIENGFALVRPPGHHAVSSRGMGFCIFNNIAIAARDALQRDEIERVMIVDYDVHHGNGTQEAFEADPDVLFISTHQYPHYPGTGWHTEIGVGEGRGTVVNIPLPVHTGDEGFSQIMELIVWPIAHRYQPDLILVSVGFDAHWTDPLASLALSLTGYASIARQLVQLANETCLGRIVFTLEGGYDYSVLSQGVQNTFHALLNEPELTDTIGPYPYPERPIAPRILEVQREHGLS